MIIYSIGKFEEGFESTNLFYNGLFIGYVELTGGVGLQHCPKCHAENYCGCVSSGTCTFCGFEIDKEAVEKVVKSKEIG